MRAIGLLMLGLTSLAIVAARGDEPTGEQAKIQGTWTILAFRGFVDDPAELQKKDAKLVITEKELTCKFGGAAGPEMSYKLDPSRKRKAIDLSEEGTSLKGIYLLEGDNLKIYWSATKNGMRPTEFPKENEKVNAQFRYLVLKRDTKK